MSIGLVSLWSQGLLPGLRILRHLGIDDSVDLEYRKGNRAVKVRNPRLCEGMNVLFWNRSLYFVVHHCVLAYGNMELDPYLKTP